jgi:hypothetical protein
VCFFVSAPCSVTLAKAASFFRFPRDLGSNLIQ